MRGSLRIATPTSASSRSVRRSTWRCSEPAASWDFERRESARRDALELRRHRPWMIPSADRAEVGLGRRGDRDPAVRILNTWSLCGTHRGRRVARVAVRRPRSSSTRFASRAARSRRASTPGTSKCPLISVGVPLVGAVAVLDTTVRRALALRAAAIPLIVLLTLIAASSTARHHADGLSRRSCSFCSARSTPGIRPPTS